MASRTNLLILVFAATIAFVMALAGVQEGDSRPRPAEKPSVEQLIEQLNSDDFQTREAATRALLERDDALPALRRALRSDSAEVRRRAEQILEAKEDRVQKQRLKRVLTHVKNGEVDQFVEEMAPLEGYLDDTTWKAVLDLADRIVAKANKEHGKKLCIPHDNKGRDKSPDQAVNLNKLGSLKNLRWLRGAVPQLTDRDTIDRCLIVSQGRVQADQIFSDNIIFANGDVTAPDVGPLMNSLVVCDGCIKGDHASRSILIATGPIKLKHGGSDVVIIEHAREALGLVKFYDTKQAGIEVAESGDAVVVKKVLEGKPFARAGMREGDRILTIDGTKIGNLEAFRRLVRRDVLANKETVFTVERPDKRTVDLTVRLTD